MKTKMNTKKLFESFNDFIYSPAIPYEKGVTRRDPSPVIKVDNLYYVWYSRTTETSDGYTATVWYATSPDGKRWTEQTEAVGKGELGSFDEHAVFTPTILVVERRYYLVYTAVPEPFTNDKGGPNCTPTALGIAEAASPKGPWSKFEKNPVLEPSDNPDEFDSLRVDDACFVVREGKYCMYYKGRQRDHGPGETKMGLAVAEKPTGPYFKYDKNPVLGSGHEVCVWPHGRGVAALISPVGPEGNTIQYSEDGVSFHRITDTVPPRAPGPYREDHYQEGKGPGISWGLCQDVTKDWPCLLRFDCDLRPK